MKNVSLFLMASMMLLMGACKSGADKKVEFKDTRWLLVTLGEEQVSMPADDKELFVVFQSDEPRYHGSAGCNNLGGSYELGEDGALKLGMGMSTMMACEDMKLEEAFLRMTEQVDSYKIEGDQLHLVGAGKVLATFKAASKGKGGC